MIAARENNTRARALKHLHPFAAVVRVQLSDLYAVHALWAVHHDGQDHGAVGARVPVHGDGVHAAKCYIF